ncbi:histidine phosphatase family protein [Erysipelothrix urinaevulpis]|uniref:histidine phosphatase family protein n=1 Tax=Erysipelothrix urinaevulpis TaxID=2683717 RepID=UPI00135A15B2|nr:histidine phosphatase family protein [Erysipelothrix urinaevulpis]
MKTEIWIVRHGETEWNTVGRLQGSKDISLNKIGLQQAQDCANYLNEKPWDCLITSPLNRAYETASVIGKELDLRIIRMDEFKEMNFGDGEGLLIHERNELLENGQFPNQEKMIDFQQRIMQGLDKIIQSYSGQRIILVAHGKVLNELLEILSDGALKSGTLGLVNGCINKLEYYNQIWKIKSYNDKEHLQTYSDIGKI